jgi:hypothetical protein
MICKVRKLLVVIALVCSHSVIAEQAEFPTGITVHEGLRNTVPVTVTSDSELVRKQTSKSGKTAKASTGKPARQAGRIEKPGSLRKPRVKDVESVQQEPEVIHLDQAGQQTDVVNTTDRFVFRDVTQRNGGNNISAAELAKRKNAIDRLRHGAGI